MKKIINKIIAVEGIDKTGKSTFVNTFDTIYHGMYATTGDILKKFSFPNANTPIGKSIRDELASITPNLNIVNTPNFLSEMSHYWMQELFNLHFNNTNDLTSINSIQPSFSKIGNINYIFDRYFISTLAYQAFYNDSKMDLEFIKTVLNTNRFIKLPTDIILLNLPNEKIIQRTLLDAQNGLNDSNDTTNETILNKRRDAYTAAIKFLSGMNIQIHWFEDISLFNIEDLIKVLLGKIFQ